MARCCNGCGWVGGAFVDHLEGPAIACPRCGLIGRDRIVLRYLDEHLPGFQNLTCLEVSASRVSSHLQQRFARLVSVDIDPISPGQMRADISALPFLDGSIDLIVCLDVLEHVKDDLAAAQEMRRVLAPGGVALVHVPLWFVEGPTAPLPPEEAGTPLYHGTSKVYWEYNQAAMLGRLHGAGLEVETVTYPDDELDLGPSNAKGPVTLFTCRRPATDIHHRKKPSREAKPPASIMTITDLLRDDPHFHFDSSGRPACWTLDPEVLSFLEPLVENGMRTLETGAGISTVFFALRGASHISITPDTRESELIQRYCQTRDISLQQVKFIIARSEDVLPRLDLDHLDMVLIDGGHGFPIPFIDWFYTSKLLRLGGLMIVDDTWIKTGRILSEFMAVDPHWKLLKEFTRTSIFEKLSHGGHLSEWTDQPYIKEAFPSSFVDQASRSKPFASRSWWGFLRNFIPMHQ